MRGTGIGLGAGVNGGGTVGALAGWRDTKSGSREARAQEMVGAHQVIMDLFGAGGGVSWGTTGEGVQ